MIEMPRRSVTRFFIPLIDVLTLLFCIFLLMPVVRPADDEGAGGEGSGTEIERRQQEKARLTREIEQLRANKAAVLQQRLAVCVLEIDGTSGKLYYYDRRGGGRRVEVTGQNVGGLIEREKEAARGKDVYFLLLRPRPEGGGIALYPQDQQRLEYDRWFEGVAHGYDIAPGQR